MDKKNFIKELISNIKLFLIGTTCTILIIGILYACANNSSDNSKNDTTDEGVSKRIACKNRSDTYYKCKWNVWEDMCTCKLR